MAKNAFSFEKRRKELEKKAKKEEKKKRKLEGGGAAADDDAAEGAEGTEPPVDVATEGTAAGADEPV